VRVTRPVLVKDVGNQLVDGAWFEFEHGRVSRYGAEKGQHVLDELLSFDDGARYLGEAALVDGRSAIFRSGLLWRNTLLDENAACHIALGRGISPAIEGGDAMSDEELRERGINSSQIHTDFMIGSPEVEVSGTAADGSTVEIIRDGTFRI
jgi:aminopeptidase